MKKDRISDTYIETPDRIAAEDVKTIQPSDDTLSAVNSLGDEQRVKVLSPGMMVLKRFLRNRLAITGLVILVIMFTFSFIGGLTMPYSQSLVFYRYDYMDKDYAGATVNTDLRYTVKAGQTFSKAAYSKLILAINKNTPAFEKDGKSYSFLQEGDSFYKVTELKILSDVAARKGLFAYTPTKGFTMTDGMKKAFETAYTDGFDSFDWEGSSYTIHRSGKKVSICEPTDVAVVSMKIYDAYDPAYAPVVDSYDFRYLAEKAMIAGDASFLLDGREYLVELYEGVTTVLLRDGSEKIPYANISGIIVNPLAVDVFLPVDFKVLAREAIMSNQKSFSFPDAGGTAVGYKINLVNSIYNIKTQTRIQLLDMYHTPDKAHLLGTDQNGMDVLTRLMYGGRISLLVGFVVVFLEMIIGIIVGGISGYFGKWADTLLMRFVDLFNCIPYWPIMIITGSYMDMMAVDSYLRIFLLMFIMGLMGWTGIARVVRGQILALREQDFMIATEATGVRVSRRIFRHLVPNVMPLLIVQATMSLGGIILTEATLSFLGLGVKYPLASWGSIINAASDPHIVTSYWFIWIPAGLLILLTVLGFNFVGDGLRDAFDPKMKR
jgi:peptide/nickel transport system permease protein